MFRKLTTVLFCAVLLLFAACTEDDPIISEIDELTQIETETTNVKNGVVEYSALIEVRIVIEGLNLSSGLKSSLLSKLDNAENQLENGQVNAAKNIIEALINQVEALSGKQISVVNADKVIGLLKLGIMQVEGLELELNVIFNNTDGMTEANDSGLTYHFGGNTVTDGSLIYAEDYWGQYPLYLPGNTAAIILEVCNEGFESIMMCNVVFEAYNMNLDGSNGIPVLNANTINLIISNMECSYVDASFVIPNTPKGLYRFISKIYVEGILLTTKETIFCPPDVALINQ